MKNAFVNAQGVLTCWGFVETNNDDTAIPVADDFDMPVGQTQYVNGQWQAYTPSG